MPKTELSSLRKTNTHLTLGTKIKRALWMLTYAFLFKPTPKRLCNSWRIFLLRLFGATIGKECFIVQSCKILQPWNLYLGDQVAIGPEAELYTHGNITIGSATVISQYTYLCTGSHDYNKRDFPLIWKDITIGSDCWIAAGAFVGPGVSIGDGTVIGAKAVVTKDMPQWSICAGNPCKVIKERLLD